MKRIGNVLVFLLVLSAASCAQTLEGKRHQMGVLAARRLGTLIDRKGREGPRKVLVQPEMVVRASTVPPREGASAVKLRARREG